MKVLISSLVLIAIAVGSTGCIVADCHHDRGYGVARRPSPGPQGPHGRDFGPPPTRHPGYPMDHGRH
jgi:hypothetical protein